MSRQTDSTTPGSATDAPVHENARNRTIAPERLNEPADGLSPQQEQAIRLLIAGASVGQVAKSLAVHPNTLYRWRHDDPAFMAELARRRQAIWDESADQMRALLPRAIEIMREHLRDPYDRARFRAAAAILRLSNVRSAIPVDGLERAADGDVVKEAIASSSRL